MRWTACSSSDDGTWRGPASPWLHAAGSSPWPPPFSTSEGQPGSVASPRPSWRHRWTLPKGSKRAPSAAMSAASSSMPPVEHRAHFDHHHAPLHASNSPGKRAGARCSPSTPSLHELGDDDEDIPAIDTTTTSTPTQLRGVITRAHARQLNQQE